MKKGFTLIELVIVMVILAILVTLGVPKFLGQSDKAQKTKLISDGRVLEDAINRYYIDEGDWPRLTSKDQPLTDAELTSKIYALNDKGFDAPFAPEEGANYYDINLEALKPYVKSFNSDIKHFVLQNPVGSVYIQDPKENTRLSSVAPSGENQQPVASFTMTPEDGITTTTEITFTSISADPDGDALTEEWTGKQSIYSEEGAYTVTLRVKDEHGLWSEPVSKTFTVISMDGVKQIAAGGGHTVILMMDGTVKAFGWNYYGQLGSTANNGTMSPNPVPATVPGLSSVKQIAAGAYHTLALLDDGTVKAFGRNLYGELGTTANNGTESPNPVPAAVSGLSSVRDIAAGQYHSLALLDDGTVKAFGFNNCGQLGTAVNNKTDNPNITPVTVAGLSGVKQIAAGFSHTIVLLDDGTVKAFGGNPYGQLGTTANSGAMSPNPVPATVPGLSGVKQIVVGSNHTLALLEDDTVKAFGLNNRGQLGTTANNGNNNPNPAPAIVSGLSGVKQIAAGSNHTLALLEDGTVNAFGQNYYGELGTTANNGTTSPNPVPATVPGLSGVKQIVAGSNHTLALLEDGTVKAFGRNQYGQLGTTANSGTSNPNPAPAIIIGL